MALKRGAGISIASLEPGMDANAPAAVDVADIVALDTALSKLESFDAQKARVVELRYFGGLSIEETAAATGVSIATVKREWAFSKLWLRREMLGLA